MTTVSGPIYCEREEQQVVLRKKPMRLGVTKSYLDPNFQTDIIKNNIWKILGEESREFLKAIVWRLSILSLNGTESFDEKRKACHGVESSGNALGQSVGQPGEDFHARTIFQEFKGLERARCSKGSSHA